MACDEWVPLKKFFNTSGMLYKQMQLKDKLPTMTEDEQIKLLATDGMLVKRPFVVGDGFVLTGFKGKRMGRKIVEVVGKMSAVKGAHLFILPVKSV